MAEDITGTILRSLLASSGPGARQRLDCAEVTARVAQLVAAGFRGLAETTVEDHAADDGQEDTTHHALYVALNSGASKRDTRNLVRSFLPEAEELCTHCPDPIEYVYARSNHGFEGGVIRLAESEIRSHLHSKSWVHVGGNTSCPAPYGSWGMATPATKCSKCGQRGTLTTEQQAWADVTTCITPGCDYHYRYSIGD